MMTSRKTVFIFIELQLLGLWENTNSSQNQCHLRETEVPHTSESQSMKSGDEFGGLFWGILLFQ